LFFFEGAGPPAGRPSDSQSYGEKKTSSTGS
jgi:hypothetical protein